ncbi:hypothetical protein, partial [Burkholderia gladioli]|uniref:hypothetical protein n=1 Tax=Burkholderia gladioli TaxID=28095 RepID=UPI001ABA2CE6
PELAYLSSAWGRPGRCLDRGSRRSRAAQPQASSRRGSLRRERRAAAASPAPNLGTEQTTARNTANHSRSSTETLNRSACRPDLTRTDRP